MKKIWIILISVLIAGVAIIAIGFGIGTKMNIFVDNKGIHFADKVASEIVADKVAEPFSDIEINADSANIEFITADKYGFEFSKNNTEVTSYSNENGKLTITKNNKIRLFNFHLNSPEKDYIKIYLPKDIKMGDVTVKNPSGNLIINKLNSKNLNIESTSGNTEINNIVSSVITINKASGNVTMTNCKADKFDVNQTSGDMKASNIESSALKIKQTSGDAIIDGKLSGDSVISKFSGDITLSIAGDKNNYNRDISVVSGNVLIDGTKTKDEHFVNAAAENSLKIDTTSGNVTVNFAS